MGRSAKPRKAYKPKVSKFEQRVAAGDLLSKRSIQTSVMSSNETLDETQQRDLLVSFGMAIDQFVFGKGDQDGINNLACMCNHALVLAELGYGVEHVPAIQATLDGVWRAKLRGEEPGGVGRYGFDGAGLTGLKDVYSIHEAQLAHATTRDLYIVSNEVHRRLLAQQGAANEHAAKRARPGKPLDLALAVESAVLEALEA